MPVRQVLLLLPLACVGAALWTVAAMGVGSRGSFAATGALHGYVLGFGYATLLNGVADYRSRVQVGVVGLTANSLVSAYVLFHAVVIGLGAVAEGLCFGMAEGLLALFLALSEGRRAVCRTGWSVRQIAVHALPLLILLSLFFWRTQMGLVVTGLALGGLLSSAVVTTVRGLST